MCSLFGVVVEPDFTRASELLSRIVWERGQVTDPGTLIAWSGPAGCTRAHVSFPGLPGDALCADPSTEALLGSHAAVFFSNM